MNQMTNSKLLEKPISTGPAIDFSDVCLVLGGTSILEKITFSVEAGSIHCLIGPNGGGKTSLLKSLLGQMPHSGSINIHWPKGETIGYVPQILDFDRTLPVTVDDFLALTCQNRPAFFGIARNFQQPVNRVLDKVNLSRKRKRILGQLSGGETQRLLLAQALLPMPDLLILDEPAAGLDKRGMTMLHDLLLELKQQGITIFWIHHDLKEVREIADSVTCINRDVVFSGRPAEVLTSERILDAFSGR